MVQVEPDGATLRLRPAVIAIDGPAASGKSTIGQRVGAALNYLFFDTGVMYRAVTVAALQAGLDVTDNDAVGDMAESILIDVAPPDEHHTDGRLTTVLVNHVDVTPGIRTKEVDQAVSPVSAHERVRNALTAQQRRIALDYGTGNMEMAGVVMVGRDIGTVVIPEAPVKVYLDATPEERARRRHLETVEKGIDVEYEAVLADVKRRDGIDSSRAIAPLQAANDAIRVDTTAMSPDEVVAALLDIVRSAAEAQD